MNGLKFTAVIITTILNPLLIIGALAAMYMGEYLAILLLLPLAIIYFSEGNRRISNAGIFFNIVFLAIPTYLLLNEIIQGTDYHLGLALTFFGIIAIAPISNIIVLYPYKKPNDQSQ